MQKRAGPIWDQRVSVSKKAFRPAAVQVFELEKVQKSAWLNAKGALRPLHSEGELPEGQEKLAWANPCGSHSELPFIVF